ncbi:hypothetical protein V8E53_000781 [Lactarius tabidus]
MHHASSLIPVSLICVVSSAPAAADPIVPPKPTFSPPLLWVVHSCTTAARHPAFKSSIQIVTFPLPYTIPERTRAGLPAPPSPHPLLGLHPLPPLSQALRNKHIALRMGNHYLPMCTVIALTSMASPPALRECGRTARQVLCACGSQVRKTVPRMQRITALARRSRPCQ